VKMSLLVALAAGLMVAADNSNGESTKEQKKLEGAWAVTSTVRNENELPAERLKDLQLIFQSDQFTWKQGDKILAKGMFQLDLAQQPRTIDLTTTEGGGKGKTTFGRYELQDDVLTICGAQPGRERPTGLAAKDGSDHTLIRLNRVKP
jgi:uncharacterized protein (TIGR03067 family)